MATNLRTRVDPRLEARASEALEYVRGRAPIQPAPSAGRVTARILAPILKDTGASLADLQRHWPDIVGERLASLTVPDKLAGGVLTVKAHGSAAPFVQHQSKLIMERANLAGARINSLAIRQGSLPARRAGNVAPLARPLGPEEEAAIAAALSGLAPGKLRDSLLRLGRAVASR
jgi:hypothetical protein